MSPVAERRRLSPEARRAQLERATLEVVAAVGYAAAGADAIAAAAGVSKGLLWHYYDDLDALMAAAARRGLAELVGEVASAVELEAPVPALLRGAIHRAARLPRTHPDHLRAIRQIVSGLRHADGSPVLDEAEYAGLQTAQQALFARGQAEGDVRPDLDAGMLAATYQAAVDGMVDRLLRHPELDPGPVAELTATVLLDGLARDAHTG
ncbi:AcrR family transcriptional regulator [Friedmanniella endophytica]|uniref:AcrR family transcriptional regulator n=1 Tax=Microlunatus kandeliicorticis TaxID=1759536 RepID=A0A7W3ISW5_9ACTN|nr:TetR family transcriptional regulator [Microlunatus kandeliicorticis]MBA8794651.1 AcrR family transcriptional regulator [Microlunatus kandeliicorticis]